MAKAKILDSPGGSSLNTQDVLAEQIEIYLKDRTRRALMLRTQTL